jgi:anti-sigma-K factor RskA
VARLVTMAASIVLVIGLATMLYWRASSPGRLADVATISTPSGALMWQIELYRDRGRLIVHGGHGAQKMVGHDYELWALPSGGAPVSLGVLPIAGSADRGLTDAQQRALLNTAQVAVTLEQTGGSPTGRPTSTPLFVVPLRTVS